MSLAEAALDESRGLSIGVLINPAKAEKVFAGSGHTFAEILAAADSGKHGSRLDFESKALGSLSVGLVCIGATFQDACLHLTTTHFSWHYG